VQSNTQCQQILEPLGVFGSAIQIVIVILGEVPGQLVPLRIRDIFGDLGENCGQVIGLIRRRGVCAIFAFATFVFLEEL